MHLPGAVVVSQEDFILVFYSAESGADIYQLKAVTICSSIGRILSDVHHSRIIDARTKHIRHNEILSPIKMQFLIFGNPVSWLAIRNNFFLLGRVNFNFFVLALGNLKEKIILRGDRLLKIILAELGLLYPFVLGIVHIETILIEEKSNFGIRSRLYLIVFCVEKFYYQDDRGKQHKY